MAYRTLFHSIEYIFFHESLGIFYWIRVLIGCAKRIFLAFVHFLIDSPDDDSILFLYLQRFWWEKERIYRSNWVASIVTVESISNANAFDVLTIESHLLCGYISIYLCWLFFFQSKANKRKKDLRKTNLRLCIIEFRFYLEHAQWMGRISEL